MDKTKKMNISILGSGSWGLGIAQILSEKYQIKIWSRDINQCRQINLKNKDIKYFPDGILSKKISCTTEIVEAIENSKTIITSIPIKALREVMKLCTEHRCENKIFISPSKGIEIQSGKFATEIYEEFLPKSCNFGCISGPNFAKELIELLPSSATISANNIETLEEISEVFKDTRIQTIKSENLITIQSLGAYKNVAAIGCGLVYKLGYNCLSTAFNNFFLELGNFVTLSLKEREQEDKNYKKTLLSPAGIGDFFGSCSSTNSRNFNFGINLYHKILTSENILCEGQYTIKALEKKLDQLPLVKSLYELIYENKDTEETIQKILQIYNK